MTRSGLTPARKKKLRTLLARMGKQGERMIPVVAPLVEMMDLTVTDEELDFLLRLGTGPREYDRALELSGMPAERFGPFFDVLLQKGLVLAEPAEEGGEAYRLNAIAVGWYETMVHYLRGKPEEKAFSQKWNELFLYFRRFNFFPLRTLQNLVLPGVSRPNQDSAIMDPAIEGRTKRMTIPVNASVPVQDANVYPTFRVNELIEEFGDRDEIYAFPCVCRYGNELIGSPCRFRLPQESCIAFGDGARAWARWGYGRHVTKEEASDILKQVRDGGAIHTVIHERDDCRLPVIAICNCCWDCCGLLKPYNMGCTTMMYRASYIARIREDADCKACGNCEKFCPTTAMRLVDGQVIYHSDKCIGCGQCAFQCRQNNIELVPDQRTVFLPLLKKSEARVEF